MGIQKNVKEVLAKVELAANKVNKTLDDITVIAVTKTVDFEKALQAVDAGLLNLGENRVQEFRNKNEQITNSNINWHIIGHLQTNKVKYIVGKVKLIHSVESKSLAEEINKRSEQHDLISEVLIEMNIGEEDSKFGLKKEDLFDFLISIENLENIKVVGLMTVAPFSENKEDVRWVFKEMKCLFDKVSTHSYKNVEMKYLSMGMTNDFEIAIEEGANIIRIGTAIFGSRVYK
ncbi:YggS family pyridoxal phosphate-dependent enzyme [Sedimentibacter sp. zth1]|uniref:YggS family pyridoxal phosphate-dependent enzyme n=1 Tax=Sedimentibacter sp. zth1 TaxID=2816908 RepID=UPI001A93211C|nr:YggS family pyridoxal phosphate-dependent enzyme [Sedimentibacter sp. zth1]QSX06883.1 YggS family pyridoxal phosphate-dependent enzyme [Sedimentibacter sp. zth1]